MRIFIILSKLILLAAAAGLEIYGLLLVFDSVSEQSLIAALFYHFIASAVAAYIFPTIVTPSQTEASLRTNLFFFVIIFYLPAIGLIGLILSIPFVGSFSSKKQDNSNLFMNINKIRDLPSEAGVTGGQPVNSHSLYDLYRSRNPERRLQAVYATLKLKDRDAIPLLRLALGDSVDDIRLLAYALLDRKEYRLSKHIEKSKQELENIENPRKKQLCRQIANDYWELAHLGLVQGEAKNHVLRMAYKYIELGLGYSPQDSGLLFQYAQILLRLGKYQQALEQFKKAEVFGIEYIGLLTYYAEIAFYSRHYQEVKQLMTEVELPAAYPLLTTTARFWQKQG